MSAHQPARQVIARYSALKLAGWMAVVVPVCVWILADGALHGWQPPRGFYSELFPGAVIGAVLGLASCLALVTNFALARGVAIARIADELVLYFPFGRKRISLRSGVTVTAGIQELEVVSYSRFLRTPRVLASQIVLQRPGQVDIRFRTGLLRDNASVIADRLSALTAMGAP